MATEAGAGREDDPEGGSQRQRPQAAVRFQPATTSVLVVASGGDDGLEVGGAQRSSRSKDPATMLSSSMVQAPQDIEEGEADRQAHPSVRECLANVPDSEIADLTLDVYNMFFLSELRSQAFVYSIATLFTKMMLYALLLVDLEENKKFPFDSNVHVVPVVKMAQLFLIPVAIVNQEELITSFFIFSHLKYSPEIKARHPGAHKWKFAVAHGARFVDGAIFLLINTAVMLLEIKDVLQIFLNFAALMFLQQIDNIALEVCLNGYWTKSLQKAAQDVVDAKFAYRHHYRHHLLQSTFVVLAWAFMLGLWVDVHFFWSDRLQGE
ncbi:hypothetical protein ACHAWF_002943 [Thalassiosira exigua]